MADENLERSRRGFLLALGGAGVVSAAGPAFADAGTSPLETVRAFCAAWSRNAPTAELAAFFTDDAVYHNIPMAPVLGQAAIAKNIDSLIRPGAPGIQSIDFRVRNIAANGRVVMTERVDAFKTPHKSFELEVMGTFEVSDGGKIKAWRDYFDIGQFAARMGGGTSP